MSDKIFLDTNVIVYAYDKSAGVKHTRAKEILIDLWESGFGVISIQVLKEFYVTVTQKIPNKLDSESAAEIIGDFLSWEVVVNDGYDILEAISIQKKHRLSFWDSLIISAAQQSGCSLLYTEDLNPGQKIRNLQIRNPFQL
ncbi:MAG: PIN domain-containing protein [Candidatus Aminicenantes bacterium]|nr:PIN domain-containing protein [Candidatus Aminicenantes bacterium]